MYYHMLSLAILRKLRYSLRHGEAAVESRRSLEVKVNEELFRLSCLANKKTHYHSLLLLVRARVSWELSEDFLLFGFFATRNTVVATTTQQHFFWLAILLQYYHIVVTQVRTVSVGAVSSFTGCTAVSRTGTSLQARSIEAAEDSRPHSCTNNSNLDHAR
jgi:hypothetical protein